MILILIFAYLLGSIPFGLIFSRFFLNIDVRAIGSGNIGATNVLRSGNKKIALLTLLCDGLKGVFAVLLAKLYCTAYCGELLILVAAGLAVLGHIFPVWLKFKGGKGVATALGVLLALHPLLCGSVAVIWALIAKIFRISSLSALIAFALSPVIAFTFGVSWEMVGFLVCLFFLLLWTHRTNIKRLIKGQEQKF